jgi:hypothetical protein
MPELGMTDHGFQERNADISDRNDRMDGPVKLVDGKAVVEWIEIRGKTVPDNRISFDNPGETYPVCGQDPGQFENELIVVLGIVPVQVFDCPFIRKGDLEYDHAVGKTFWLSIMTGKSFILIQKPQFLLSSYSFRISTSIIERNSFSPDLTASADCF